MRPSRAVTVHATLGAVSVVMLVPFYWVLKTSLTGENIFQYPPALLPRAVHPFYYVDVWYYIPFVRYLINSVIVSVIVVAANLVCNALAAYALTLRFRGKRAIVALLLSCMLIPFQATIIPAYLITKELHLLNSHLGLALPLCSTIVCIFVFKASFDAVPRSLIDAARIDGLAEWRIIRHVMLPLSTSAVATTLHGEHYRRALRVLHHGAGAGGRAVPARAAPLHRRPHVGSDQGMRYVWVAAALVLLIGSCTLWVGLHDDGVVRGRVVQPDGQPAAGATVSFWEKTLTTLERRAATQTGSDGRFVLTGQPAHHFALQAEKSGFDASPRT
ncbi:MAG: hypothetical protein DMD94_26785, partial [Candidatus Rokuibacteriota bacterium]